MDTASYWKQPHFLFCITSYVSDTPMLEIQHFNQMQFSNIFALFISISKSADNSTTMELISPLILIFWSFASVSMYCEFGTAVTDEFARFSDELCQCAWYSLPNGIQKMLVIFIAETQEPIIVRGFCNIMCTRQTFKTVNNFILINHHQRSNFFKFPAIFFILFRRFMRHFHILWRSNESMVKCYRVVSNKFSTSKHIGKSNGHQPYCCF